MRYYLIAGEASGDLHASHLIAALKREDPEAEFRGFGGDLMEQAGMTLVRHYRDLAFMGVFAVVMHLRTILEGMKQCKQDIMDWKPDVVILVDYPGFNLKMAKFIHAKGLCPVYYYIAPKLWAWKEWRIKAVRRDVDEIFSILPFEVDFFEKKHGYPIHYVGNPTVDEIAAYQKAHPITEEREPGVIALLEKGSPKGKSPYKVPRKACFLPCRSLDLSYQKPREGVSTRQKGKSPKGACRAASKKRNFAA